MHAPVHQRPLSNWHCHEVTTVPDRGRGGQPMRVHRSEGAPAALTSQKQALQSSDAGHVERAGQSLPSGK